MSEPKTTTSTDNNGNNDAKPVENEATFSGTESLSASVSSLDNISSSGARIARLPEQSGLKLPSKIGRLCSGHHKPPIPTTPPLSKMVMCFAPDCKHYSERRTCSFFRFPKDPALLKTWITLIRRDDKDPTPSSLICSCHFVNGDKSNLPSLFKHNEKKLFTFQSPEKKKRRYRQHSDTTSVIATGDPSEVHSSGTAPNRKPEEIQEVSEVHSSDNAPICVDYSSPGPSRDSEEIQEVSAPMFVEYSAPGPSRDSEEIEAVSATVDPNEAHSSHNAPMCVDYSSPGPSRVETNYEKMQNLLGSGSAQQEAEMYFLKKENELLKKQLQNLSIRFSFDVIKNNDKLVNVYTGLPNVHICDSLYSLFKDLRLNYTQGWTVGLIPKKDQLLLTLMKLRLNILHNDLACRFNCSQATVSNVVSTWIHAIHEILFCQLMASIPSRHKNKQCMPACFSTFTNCRIVLDCTEVKCIRPSSLEKQRSTYSSYKHQNTVKGLIGVAPNGVVTFASDLYPGSTSDKKIVQDCAILEKMVSGDLILADKGFLILDILPEGVHLNLPPFLTTPQFTPQQVIQTRTIARARIHVERAIQRMKCFSILDSIPQSLLPQSTQIFQVCAALTNLQFPLIAEVGGLYKTD